jgi:hypothetical protein
MGNVYGGDYYLTVVVAAVCTFGALFLLKKVGFFRLLGISVLGTMVWALITCTHAL